MSTHTRTLPCDNLDLWISGDGDMLNATLEKVAGLSMFDSCQGVLDVGKYQAEVRFEPPQWIHVSSPIVPTMDSDDALRRNHWLPGNVRYAGNNNRMKMLADTQIDGISHLASCFADIRHGVTGTINDTILQKVKSDHDAITSTNSDEMAGRKLKTVLGGLPFGENSIVCRKSTNGFGAWEIRPRIKGETVPVLLDELSEGVRLHRTILDRTTQSCRVAVADQALRLNEQIRFCRFALVGDDLVVETLLHAGLIEESWLTSASLAVASVSHWAQDVLNVLAQHEHVASWHQIIFCDRTLEKDLG